MFTQIAKKSTTSHNIGTLLQLYCLFTTGGSINQNSKVCVNSSADICFGNFSPDYEPKVCLSFRVNVRIHHFKSKRSCLNNLREKFREIYSREENGTISARKNDS